MLRKIIIAQRIPKIRDRRDRINRRGVLPITAMTAITCDRGDFFSVSIAPAAQPAVIVPDASAAVIPIVELAPGEPAILGLAHGPQRIAGDINPGTALRKGAPRYAAA